MIYIWAGKGICPPTLGPLFSKSQASIRRAGRSDFFTEISCLVLWGERRGGCSPDTYQRHRRGLYQELYTISTMCTPVQCVQFSQWVRQLCVGCEGVQLSQRPSDLYPGLPQIWPGQSTSEPDIHHIFQFYISVTCCGSVLFVSMSIHMTLIL